MKDIDIQNATYVAGSLTNALDTTTPDSSIGDFLAPHDIIEGVRTSLTHKIKFQIRLNPPARTILSLLSFNKPSATLSVAVGLNGFYFGNDTSKAAATDKFFSIKINQEMTTAEKALNSFFYHRVYNLCGK